MSEHPSETEPDDVAGLRAEMASLRAQLADVEGRLAAASPEPAPTATRRSLLALAGGAAAAAVAAATALSRTPALATSTPLNIDEHNLAPTGAAFSGTELDYGIATPNPGTDYFTVHDQNGPVTGTSAFPAAVAGWATLNLDVGVYGMSTRGGANSIGVVGSSASGYDVALRGGGRASFTAATTGGPPTSGTGALGDLFRDAVGDWFVCATAGSPGVWRKLGGPSTAGALHVINPIRVYDSRLVGGILASGGNRTVNVANGISITTGAITSPNVVPNGATAITYNLTITQAALSGFLAVTPGDATGYTASTINWSNGTTDLANGTLVKLDGARNVKVFLGGPGTTHFLIDITGYYL